MVTALTLYGTGGASSTLTTAAKLTTGTGGTVMTVNTSINAGNGYYELYGKGGGASSAVTSLPSPTGNGWLWDVTTLEGQQLVSGSYTLTGTVAIGSGTLASCSLSLRLYKYSSSNSTYTAICSGTSSTFTLTTTATAYSISLSGIAAFSFVTGDKLYLDAFLNGIPASARSVHVSVSSTSLGIANDMQVTTPGYQAGSTTATRDSSSRFLLLSTVQDDTTSRFRLQGKQQPNLSARLQLMSAAVTLVATTRFLLKAFSNKDSSTRFRLSVLVISQIAARLHLQGMVSALSAFRYRLLAYTSKDGSQRFRLSVTILQPLQTRVRFLGNVFPPWATRFHIQAQVQRQIASRFPLAGQSQQNSLFRFVLNLPSSSLVGTSLRFLLKAFTTKDGTLRFRLFVLMGKDSSFRMLLRGQVQQQLATRLRLLGTTIKQVQTRFILFVFSSRSLQTRLQLLAIQTKNATGRFVLGGVANHTPLQSLSTRFQLLPSIGKSPISVGHNANAYHSFLLPDNSLVVVYQAGTDTTWGTANTGIIVVQSFNWQSSNPTWSFVQQVISNTTDRVSAWFDTTTHKLHTVSSVTGIKGSSLSYFSGTYSQNSGTWGWIWDSVYATIGSIATGSNAVIVSDGATNSNVYVAYRNDTSGVSSLQMVVYDGTAASWGTPYQLSLTTSSSASINYEATLSRVGTSVVCAIVEPNANVSLLAHPDGNILTSSGWSSATTATTLSAIPNFNFGVVGLFGQTATTGWLSYASAGTVPGVFAGQFTLSLGGTSGTQTATFTLPPSFTTLDPTNGSSSGQWSRSGDTLYLFYYQQPATNADVWYCIYNIGSGLWSAPINLTNNAVQQNVQPTVPASDISGVSASIPVFYSTGTATTSPIVQQNVPVLHHNVFLRMNLSSFPQTLPAASLRFRLFASAIQKSANTRLLLASALTQRFTSARLRLAGVSQQNAVFRFLLNTANTPLRNALTRFRMIATRVADSRFRVVVMNGMQRFLLTRLLMQAVAARNASTRFPLASFSVRTIVTRFLLVIGITNADSLLRFLLHAPPAPGPIVANLTSPMSSGLLIVAATPPDSFPGITVNGTALSYADTPNFYTVPRTAAGTILAGETFSFVINTPSSAAQSLLTTTGNTIVTLQYFTGDGTTVQVPVLLTPSLINNSLHVYAQVTDDTPYNTWVIQTQFF